MNLLPQKPQEGAGVYSTRRANSYSAAMGWRYILDQDIFTDIQEACGEAIQELGYNMFDSVEDLRDMNIPHRTNFRLLERLKQFEGIEPDLTIKRKSET